MNSVRFFAPEYRADGTFESVAYEYAGDENAGWTVRRDGQTFLRLGPGYRLLRTLRCGVCSTDLARKFLPYPLPQIIGHEVVALDARDRPVVVEINASHHARGLHPDDCPYCLNGLATQCPERVTLGIDRLPGGFAPYLLAPVKAIFEIPPNVSSLAASLTEPFAAALHGIETSAPRTGESVAVLGPRRLGLLTLAALQGYRKRTGFDFEIVGIVRHDNLRALCEKLGADRIVDARETDLERLGPAFDLVFDTTGKPDGFTAALGLARRRVHLKSTHGRSVLGLDHLSDLVVDELALRHLSPDMSDFRWPQEESSRANANVFVAPGVPEAALAEFREKTGRDRTGIAFHRLSVQDALSLCDAASSSNAERRRLLPRSPFGRFDLALVSEPEEIDAVIRPRPGEDRSLIRPRGALFLCESENAANETDFAPLRAALGRGVGVDSSRCGVFSRALATLAAAPEIARTLETEMITHSFALSEIETAFSVAADSRTSVKVVVDTRQNHA